MPALPRVIAHRGASAEMPENTLASFRRALDLGCRAIELDVHLTRDGECLVIHDDRFERTTDGAGPVRLATLAEARALDAGAWKGMPGERVPTLRECLLLAKERGAFVNIEIKAATDGPYEGIEDKVATDVEATGMEERVFVTSFEPDIPQRYVARHRAAGAGVIVLGAPDEAELRAWAKFAQAVGLYADLLAPEWLDAARAAGLTVVAWVVNDPARARALLDMGVAAVITDDPRALRSLL